MAGEKCRIRSFVTGTACAMKSRKCDGWHGKEKRLGSSGWKTRKKYTVCKKTSSGWDHITK